MKPLRLNETAIKVILYVALIAAIGLPLYNILVIYPAFEQQFIENIEDEAILVANHLSSMFVDEINRLSKENLPHHIGHFAQKAKEEFKLWKLRLFSASGEIIYCTDPKDIGQVNTQDYFHEIVATGKTYTAIVHKDTLTADGQKASLDVAEVYVPIIKDGSFIGAFEIYYDITSKKNRLESLIRHYTFVLFLICLLSVTLVAFLFIANKNVTDAKAEATKNKAFLDSILYSSIDLAIAATDKDFRITYFNPLAEKITGYKASEVVGKTVMQMHTKEKVSPERFQKAIENVMTKGEHRYTVEQKRDNDTVYYSARVSGIFDNRGSLIGYLWTASDISEIIKAQRALKDSLDDLITKNNELERFHKITVDRELKMVELKKEINELFQKAGQPSKYHIPDDITS